ncbi:hypothetical protein HER21_28590 [Pseudomonas sp. BGM005]|nr:hypothetical protein [Pseudomonas sp. BG5]
MNSESNNLVLLDVGYPATVQDWQGRQVRIELWADHWSGGMQRDAIVTVAQKTRTDLETSAFRAAFNGSEKDRMVYANLRWLLLVLSKSKIAPVRRLTWRERITGRVRP